MGSRHGVRRHSSDAPNRRAVKNTPEPPSASMQMIKSEMVRLRADPKELAAWCRRARKNRRTLSEFLRAAAGASAADIVTDDAWKARLLLVRSAMNLALHVRTPEQKNVRIEEALSIINATLEVAHAGAR